MTNQQEKCKCKTFETVILGGRKVCYMCLLPKPSVVEKCKERGQFAHNPNIGDTCDCLDCSPLQEPREKKHIYKVGELVKFKKIKGCDNWDADVATIIRIDIDPIGNYGSYLLENKDPMILGWFNENMFEPLPN